MPNSLNSGTEASGACVVRHACEQYVSIRLQTAISRRANGGPEPVKCGAPGGIRTPDPWFRRPVLYPLSYERRWPQPPPPVPATGHRPPANNTGRPPEAALSRTAHIESSATPYCRQTFCRISRDEEEPHRGSWRQHPVERAAINVARPCPCSASQTKAKSSALVSSVPISATVFMSESESTAAAQSDPAGARATSGTRAGSRPRVLE